MQRPEAPGLRGGLRFSDYCLFREARKQKKQGHQLFVGILMAVFYLLQ